MIQLSLIKTAVDHSLKTTVGTAITTAKFVDAANRAVDILLEMGDYPSLRRRQIISVLDGESDYDIEENLGIDDYKQVFDLRPVDKEYPGEFEYRGEKKFAARKSQSVKHDEYTVEEVDGKEVLRLLKYHSDASSVVLHAMDSLTADGTWSAISASDAVSVAVNTTRKKQGSGSIDFDIDVSNDAADLAGIELSAAMTAVDISDYENIGRFRFWIDLRKFTAAQLALITSIELRVGSSSSVYLKMTTDVNALGGSFTNNWNRVSFNWEDGTETGSPDYENVDYLAVIVNYSSTMTDVEDVLVDEIKLFEPEDMEFWYYSRRMVAPTTTSATFQERFSTTYNSSEALRLPRSYLPVVADLILSILFPMKTLNNDPKGLTHWQMFLAGWNRMLDNGHAVLPKKEDEEAQVQGNSSGRVEGHLMW